MSSSSVVFPGTFDPPTYGHLNIIERACSLFDKVHVVVAVNREKSTLFTAEERLDMLTRLTRQWANVTVAPHYRLIVEYARAHNIRLIIRGVRNVQDFEYEFDLSLGNRFLDPEIETVLVPTEPRFFVLKSSSIKDLASFGGDLSQMVPPLVAKALMAKLSPTHSDTAREASS
jgi:pantetheine-phosphate adenylyltransferase